jgi:hypothetical protein
MDNEFGITGKSYITEFREHNPFIGSWWSVYLKPTPSEIYNPIIYTLSFGVSFHNICNCK